MREPISIPLDCLGLSYDSEDAQCQTCPHAAACRLRMGARLGRLPLSKAVFKFLPEALEAERPAADPEAADLAGLYQLCYETVFSERGDSLARVPQAAQKLAAAAADSSCSYRLYILANMLGYRQSSPDRKFYANMLFGERALKRVDLFRRACTDKYGLFDVNSLNSLLGSEVNDTESALLRSELLVGSFIVGYKIRSSGDPLPELYLSHETDLDPCWLATDPNYPAYLKREPDCTKTVARHRFAVSQCHAELKRSKVKARAVFQLREKIMPEAIKQVLNQHGFQPDSFLIKPEPISGGAELWRKLGVAMQHYWLLQYYATGDLAFLKRVS